MKIAFDVDVIRDLGVTKMVQQVADWGYKYIEQSPHPQINPFYKHPKASREIMAEYKNALKATGVEISSFIVVYRWSGPGRRSPPGGGQKLAADDRNRGGNGRAGD
jgi:myo-inositol catabolism protein IolH